MKQTAYNNCIFVAGDAGGKQQFDELPSGSADFQACCIAGFPTRVPWLVSSAADLEIGDTAGWETCATAWHKVMMRQVLFYRRHHHFNFICVSSVSFC